METVRFATRSARGAVLGMLVVLVAAVAVPAQDGAWTLSTALKQLDATASDFSTAVADVEMNMLESEGTEPQTASGKGYFSQSGSFRIELTSPEAKTLLCTGSDLFIYDPAQAIVEHYPLGKHPERLEGYASLGFSLTGQALSKSYLVGLTGEENEGDHKVLRFELTPKSDKLRASVSRVLLTIDEGSWLPLEQKVLRGDAVQYLELKYRHLSRNVSVDGSTFKPKWPKGTQTVQR
jgi:outer membrane lipoprotein-sorting protein